jgi:hypothetical protein
MHGLAAITANNGWAMALAGACIVLSGLAFLSFFISRLHKIITLFEGKKKHDPLPQAQHHAKSPAPVPAEINYLNDLSATVCILRSLTLDLGDAFELATLYRSMQKENLPHPHITIRSLREAGFLAPTREGKFCWKNS